MAQVNNSPRANIIPAWEANFGQAMYRSQERLPENTRDGFARSHLFGLYPSSLSKSAGFISLAGKASLLSISAAILFVRS